MTNITFKKILESMTAVKIRFNGVITINYINNVEKVREEALL